MMMTSERDSSAARPGIAPSARLLTPPGVPAALAVVALDAPSAQALAPVLRRVVGLDALPAASVRLVTFRDRAGQPLDTGLACAWSSTRIDLFPHGGPLVVQRLLDALAAAGCVIAPASDPAPDPRTLFPEADTLLEARMLLALARAASPLAVDLLLDQPRRWASPHDGPANAAALRHLLTPPLVAAVGAPNIGKSSLLNALARQHVALVADVPGTTRDAVGCLLELDGLTIRYLDCPGFTPHPATDLDAAAQHAALDAVQRADLVLLCADASPAPHALPSVAVNPFASFPPVPVLRVALRADRLRNASSPLAASAPPAPSALPGFDAVNSASARFGLDALARAVRRALVPDAALTDPRPWHFWA